MNKKTKKKSESNNIEMPKFIIKEDSFRILTPNNPVRKIHSMKVPSVQKLKELGYLKDKSEWTDKQKKPVERGIIYAYVDTIGKNKIYSGQSTEPLDKRHKTHRTDKERHIRIREKKSNGNPLTKSENNNDFKSHFYNAWIKYGEENLDKRVLFSIKNQPQAVLDAYERYTIATLELRHRDIGYNIHPGGSGGKLLDETKELLRKQTIKNYKENPKLRKITSEKSLEMWNKEGFKEEMSEIHKQSYINNPELNGLISKTSLKMWKREGFKEKRSENSKGEKNPFYGKKHTPETKETIGNKSSERNNRPEINDKIRKASIRQGKDQVIQHRKFNTWFEKIKKKHKIKNMDQLKLDIANSNINNTQLGKKYGHSPKVMRTYMRHFYGIDKDKRTEFLKDIRNQKE